MTKLAALPAALALCALLAVPALAATKSVTVGDTFFKANAVTVSKGTTVKWTWKGSLPHNVKVTSGPAKFHSTLKTRGTYSHTMTRRGTYRIVCSVHANMKMTVTVR